MFNLTAESLKAYERGADWDIVKKAANASLSYLIQGDFTILKMTTSDGEVFYGITKRSARDPHNLNTALTVAFHRMLHDPVKESEFNSFELNRQPA